MTAPMTIIRKDLPGMRKLVILGGGYGGLSIAAKLLGGTIPDDMMTILIDRMPYQGLKTEYYALASGSVSEMDIRTSFPTDPRLILHFAEVNRIDLAKKLVQLNGEDWISYDWLVISLGCVDLFRNIPGAREYAHSIQTLSAARQTYQKIFEVKPYGQVTIIGGGLSGVEVASELRENRT
jgi:NADH dehydrogenase